MPRKKVIASVVINDSNELNETLRDIAETKSAVDEKVAAYNEKEAQERKSLDDFCNPLRTKIAGMEEAMRLFCEDNRAEFSKKKSKELPNGTVSFRLGTPKAKTIKGWTWKAVLEILKSSKKGKMYIRTKEEIDKELVIRDYQAKNTSNTFLAKFGMAVEQDETFGYDLNLASEN